SGGGNSVMGPRCGVAATAGGPVGSAASRRIPDRPARSAAANSGTLLPSAQTTPQPVTTTLCFMVHFVASVTGFEVARFSCDQSFHESREVAQRAQVDELFGRDLNAVVRFDCAQEIERGQ